MLRRNPELGCDFESERLGFGDLGSFGVGRVLVLHSLHLGFALVLKLFDPSPGLASGESVPPRLCAQLTFAVCRPVRLLIVLLAIARLGVDILLVVGLLARLVLWFIHDRPRSSLATRPALV